jgi:lipopolysaccharide cholinephosphotransferase
MSEPVAEGDERVQATLLQALRDVDAACVELSLPYWIDAGTLLGAVRHGGFIPWDDDIDICMSRQDFARFLSSAPALLGDNYRIRTRVDDKFIAVSAKVFIAGTHMRSSYSDAHGIPPLQDDALGIDVVVVEPVSRWAVIRRIERQLSGLVATKPWARYMAASPTLESRRKRLRWAVAAHVPDAVVETVRSYLLATTRRRSGRVLGFAVDELHSPRAYPREVIYPLGEQVFEGMTVPAPHDSEAYLRGLYGPTYMQLPPPSERRTHTDQVHFDRQEP